MRRCGRPRTRSVAKLGSPPQTENREEPLEDTVGESVLHAHEQQPQPQQNPDIHQKPVARLTVDQFMDIFEGLIVNVARREVEVRTGTQNTIERARDLRATTFEGMTDPVSSESWLIRLRKIFNVMRCTDKERLSFTEFLLEGNAYHWWMSILRRYGRHGDITWADFQREFTDK